MTVAQKLLARAAGKATVRPGEIVIVEPDVVMTHDHQGPMAVREFETIGAARVWNPAKVVIVMDHRTPTQSTLAAENHRLLRGFAARQGIGTVFDVGEGICHDLLLEKGLVTPGKVVVASDSHVLTVGALGAFAVGVGSSELAVVWVRGRLWLRVPETIKVTLSGSPGAFIGGKDIALKLLAILRTDGATYRAVEFHGPGLRHLNLDERMTICNMCLEMGAKTAFVPPDEITRAFLRAKGLPEPTADCAPDPGASYCREVDIDLAALPSLVAQPFSPDNTATAADVETERVRIDQAIIGTCTNGRLSDLRVAAELVAGRRVASGVRFLVVPGTREILLRATREGIVEKLLAAGAMVGIPSCGPCGAYGMGALASDETCITAGSRNFVGRMGAPEARIYLGSSATVAASAVAGRIVDPRNFASVKEV